MIKNATLVSIAQPVADAMGDVDYAMPQAIGSRCAMLSVEQSQKRDLGDAISDAQAVMYFPKVASFTLLPGLMAVVTVDGSASRNYRIVYVRDWQKYGGLSHWECFLAELKP